MYHWHLWRLGTCTSSSVIIWYQFFTYVRIWYHLFTRVRFDINFSHLMIWYQFFTDMRIWYRIFTRVLGTDSSQLWKFCTFTSEKIVPDLYTINSIKCESWHPKNYRNWPYKNFIFWDILVHVSILHMMVWNLRSVKYAVQQSSQYTARIFCINQSSFTSYM